MTPPPAPERVPIADYGLIGDTRSAALVSPDGSIDWLCLPRFDSEPVFARLLAGPKGGSFAVSPVGEYEIEERRYRPHTTTIETIWRVDAGSVVTLADAMIAKVAPGPLPATTLVRHIDVRGGPVDVQILFDPRAGASASPPRSRRIADALVCEVGSTVLALTSDVGRAIPNAEPTVVTVHPGSPVTLVLTACDRSPALFVAPKVALSAADDDERSWREWCEGLSGPASARGIVVRSLLTLRLLTYSPSGAPVAAPTTSLPEELGGARNWDYRFAWPRDASIGIAAFLGCGKRHEAEAFLAWLMHASRLERPRLPPLLAIDGRAARAESNVDSWPGYASSSPVRFGNEAADQHQLDTYGWVVDALWLLTDAGVALHSEAWRVVRGFADEVERRWRQPDAGIWEVRGEPRQFVHSKLMAWLALDRAIAIGERRGVAERLRRRWDEARVAIETELHDQGTHPGGFYRRSYGADDVDAALLLAPVVGMDSATSPVVRSTINAIRDRLSAGGPLLYRYPPGSDGIEGGEGAFVACSFWLVQALAMAGDVGEAEALFDKLVAMASPLGLYAEEIDPATGEHLGNYPQALSHAALVQAALALARAAEGRGR